MEAFRIYPLGDRAVTVSFGTELTEETARSVLALRSSLEGMPIMGMEELVPSYATLTVFYDPELVRCLKPESFPHADTVSAQITRLIRERLRDLNPSKEDGCAGLVEVPVCYEDGFAPDIGYVARHAGMGVDDVISLHLSKTYRVYMTGFVPGFPYMGEVDPRLQVPRKQEPRLRVVPGSVALAGRQTGIYPMETPGGWQVIGCTPLRLFDAGRDPCCLLEAGMQVRFRRIGKEDFETLVNRWP
jgi:inhibitor of KinA